MPVLVVQLPGARLFKVGFMNAVQFMLSALLGLIALRQGRIFEGLIQPMSERIILRRSRVKHPPLLACGSYACGYVPPDRMAPMASVRP